MNFQRIILQIKGHLFIQNVFKIHNFLPFTPLMYNTQQCKLMCSNKLEVLSTSKKDGFIKRLFKKYDLFNYSSNRMKVAGHFLYESTVDKIKYVDLIRHFNLPDTFYTWFLITELHIWMLSVRAMAENNGNVLRNGMIEALWTDVVTRAKKFDNSNPSAIRSQINELCEQFQSAIISYDEGLLSNNDCVLAEVIWKRLFVQNCDNPLHIERFVKYIRKQIKVLDETPIEYIVSNREIKWLSIFEM